MVCIHENGLLTRWDLKSIYNLKLYRAVSHNFYIYNGKPVNSFSTFQQRVCGERSVLFKQFLKYQYLFTDHNNYHQTTNHQPQTPAPIYNATYVLISNASLLIGDEHYYAIRWKHFPRYWPFVRGIHRSPANSPHKGQRRGASMFSLICARINSWVNNGEAGDLRSHRAHCDVMVMAKIEVHISSTVACMTKVICITTGF